MIETALILSLALPAFLLAYIAFQLKDRHSSMKMFLTNASLIFAMGIPFTGWVLADNQSVAVVEDYLIYFELAAIMVTVVFVFYSIWLYLVATGKVVSGTKDGFNEDGP